MSAIEFLAPAGRTFSVQLYNAATNVAIGSAITDVVESTVPSRYRADTGAATGIVFVVATSGNVRRAGYANLSDPTANGFSALVDSMNEADLLKFRAQMDQSNQNTDVTVHQIRDFDGNAYNIASPQGSEYQLDKQITVLPGRDRGLPQSNRSRIVVAQGELITIARQVVDGNGASVNLSGRTLQIVIQDARGTDIAVVPVSSISISGTNDDTYSFVVPFAASARVGNYLYALNDVGTSKAELVKGDWIVESRPLADA